MIRWIALVMILMVVGVSAGGICPYSGYVPGNPGIPISGNSTHEVINGRYVRIVWEEISYSTCWGVCPADLKEVQDAWRPINRSVRFELINGSWYEKEWVGVETARQGSLVMDWYWNYTKVGGDVIGNQTVGPRRITEPPAFTIEIDKDFILTIVKLLIG
jgi:hypothetical protein